MTTKMIIRSNLEAPEIVIKENEPLEAILNSLLRRNTDPTSIFYIKSEYILFRLFDCAKRALQSSHEPGDCPIMFDSWSCWNSTPPELDQFEMCPNFVNLGFRSDRLAMKSCTEDGSWWVHPATNRWVMRNISRKFYIYILSLY